MAETTVFVRFTTKLETRFVIPKKEAISVPSNLKRLGLSQLINHLLNTDSNPTPFDFLINKRLLRTSLQSYISKYLSGDEQVIEVEYILALGVSDDNGFKHDDWVSAVDKHQFQSKNGQIITGCYDNVIRFWNFQSAEEPTTQLAGHIGPVKCLSSYLHPSGELTLVSGSQDQSLYTWKVNATGTKAEHQNTLIGHTGSIEDCDIHKNGKFVLSSSWDNSIKLWDLSLIPEPEEEQPTKSSSKDRTKRRRLDAAQEVDPKWIKASATFAGHKQPVSGVQWKSDEEFVSVAWDHSIKIWDVENPAGPTSTLSGNGVIYGLSILSDASLIVSCHADKTVRLWDSRQSEGEISTTLASHKGWVSCVSAHPTLSHLFLSGSYDNTIKVWDTRSTTPLHTVSTHTDKVLSLGWYDETTFISGGADNQLKTHKLTNQSQ